MDRQSDYPAGKYWFPTGVYGIEEYAYSQFCGSFDGQGHTISNMSVVITEAFQRGGLFGYVYSDSYRGVSIKNIHMESPSVTRNVLDKSYANEDGGAGCLAGSMQTGYPSIDYDEPFPIIIENVSVHNGIVASNPNNVADYLSYD